MTQKKLEKWLARFNRQINAAFRCSFAACDLAVQAEATTKLQQFARVLDAKRDRLSKEDDECANNFLGFHCYAESVINLLQMWTSVRNGDAHAGWDFLISAQDLARSAMRASELCSNCMDEYAHHLIALERIVFPRQQFVSSSIITKRSKCSLCDGPMHECDHIPGMAYNGTFCIEIVEEISGVDHLALVDDPEDKRCRLTQLPRDGYSIDSLTFERLEESVDDD